MTADRAAKAALRDELRSVVRAAQDAGLADEEIADALDNEADALRDDSSLGDLFEDGR